MRTARFIRWWYASFKRNVAKGKYYSIMRFFTDSKYRADIMYMYDLLTAYKISALTMTLPLDMIHASHEISYPGWVDYLEQQLVMNPIEKVMEPMKVFYDPYKGRYMVIDGNHRLSALKRTFPPGMDIEITLLYPVGIGRDYGTERSDKGQGEVRVLSRR